MLKVLRTKTWLLLLILFSYACFSDPVTGLIVEPNQREQPIIEAIDHAQHAIDLVMYGFTDRKIRSAMLNAEKRGVSIRIILEKEPYLSAGENDRTLRLFQNKHIPIKQGGRRFALTHQKTLIIDGKQAWIMTMNFTRSAFTDQRNFAALVTQQTDVSEIETIFNQDWQNKDMPTDFEPNLVWSPINSRSVINHLILQAQDSLEIYAPELDDYQIIGSLALAARHGVKITVIMPAPQNNTPQPKLNYLRQHGVKVVFSQTLNIHAKLVLADSGKPDQAAYLGSANLTSSSLDKNRELGIIIKNPIILAKIHKVFLLDLDSTPHAPRPEREKKKLARIKNPLKIST